MREKRCLCLVCMDASRRLGQHLLPLFSAHFHLLIRQKAPRSASFTTFDSISPHHFQSTWVPSTEEGGRNTKVSSIPPLPSQHFSCDKLWVGSEHLQSAEFMALSPDQADWDKLSGRQSGGRYQKPWKSTNSARFLLRIYPRKYSWYYMSYTRNVTMGMSSRVKRNWK